MKYSVIIPAAGSSQRVGTFDKLLFKINNEPVIKHSIANFQEDKECRQIILVVKESNYDFYKKMFRLYNKLLVVKGKATRFESVLEGFKHINQEFTLIHDGARPYLSETLLENVKNHLLENDVVIPTISVVDSMICVKDNNQYVDRNIYRLVQTPQGFRTEILQKAYELQLKDNKITNFSDEGSLVAKLLPKTNICLIEGETKNKKITFESDFEELFCLD